MFTLALIISSIYMFICSASLAEDFTLTKEREGAQVMTFAISVMLYMLSQVLETTHTGNYMFSSVLSSSAAIIIMSYFILDIIEKCLNVNDLYNSKNSRVINSVPRKEFF